MMLLIAVTVKMNSTISVQASRLPLDLPTGP